MADQDLREVAAGLSHARDEFNLAYNDLGVEMAAGTASAARIGRVKDALAALEAGLPSETRKLLREHEASMQEFQSPPMEKGAFKFGEPETDDDQGVKATGTETHGTVKDPEETKANTAKAEAKDTKASGASKRSSGAKGSTGAAK